MSFHLKSKPKSRINGLVFISILFFLVLFLVSVFAPIKTTGAAHSFFKPFWFVKEKSVNMGQFFSGFFSFKSSLIKENNAQKEELNNLRMLKVDYENLLKESSELKDQFGINISNRKIISQILSKPPQSPFDTLVIDVGVEDGVALDDKVYISDTIIVGKIAEVTQKTSIVKLFSSGGEEIEVTSSRTGANFLIKGSGGANFSLEVPKETDIVWGDTFMYPGENSSNIATVYFVDTNSQSSFKTVNLRYPVNIFQSKRVFVLKNI